MLIVKSCVTLHPQTVYNSCDAGTAVPYNGTPEIAHGYESISVRALSSASATPTVSDDRCDLEQFVRCNNSGIVGRCTNFCTDDPSN